MIALCRRISENPSFQNAVLAVVAANALLVGLATDPQLEIQMRRNRVP